MKKIFSLFILILVINICKAQFTNTQTISNANTLYKPLGGLTAGVGMIMTTYADTTAANLTPLKFYDGAIIKTTSPIASVWYRNLATTQWVQINPAASGGTYSWDVGGNNNFFGSALTNEKFGTLVPNKGIAFTTNSVERVILSSTGLGLLSAVTDTTANKVMTFNPTTKAWNYGYWYGGSGGGGSGTVTSVGLTVTTPSSPAFSVSNTPITTSGNINLNLLGTASQMVLGNGALGSSLPSALVPTWQQTLTAGSTINVANNVAFGNNTQTWNWSTLGDDKRGIVFGRNPNGIYGTGRTGMVVDLEGTHTGLSQTSTGIYIRNITTGTTNTGYGIYIDQNNAITNISAHYGATGGDINYGAQYVATSGIEATAAQFSATGAITNTAIEIVAGDIYVAALNSGATTDSIVTWNSTSKIFHKIPFSSFSVGTVTSFSATDGNGFDFTVTNPTTTPTLTATTTVTNNQFMYSNSGAITGDAAILHGGTGQLILGATGVSSGSLALVGTTSGSVGIIPQAAAGSYNFNLPTTAGTSGQVLTSGGGISTPMTWTTPTTGTVTSVSGTTNRITVATGTTTPVIDISASYVGQSSITTLGTIGTGVWQGTLVGSTYGGTGVNNGSSTITLGGNLVTSGAFATTLTSTATTNATLPAGTNTLYSTKSASITSAQLLASLSDPTGTGVAMFGTSPAATTSITTPSTTFALLNTTATTINAFGAATTVNTGASATQIWNFGGSTTASEFRFLEPSGGGTNYTAFKAVSMLSNITYSLPPTTVAGGVWTDVAGNGVLTSVVPSGGGITIGTTTITSGTNTRVLYNNSGVVGEYTTTGTGTELMKSASPTTTGTLTAAIGNFSGLLSAAALIRTNNGTKAAPSLAFTNQTGTGFYYDGTYSLESMNGVTVRSSFASSGGTGICQVDFYSPSSTAPGDGKSYSSAVLGDTWSTSGIFEAGSAVLLANSGLAGGFNIGTGASAPIKFWTNGTVEATISSAGVITLANLAGTGSRAVLADASGNLSAPVSDRFAKKNIHPLMNGLEAVMQLNPVTFEYKKQFQNYGTGQQVGFIAQDVERVLPNSVFTTPSTGLKGINKEDILPLLVCAIQSQQKEINELKEQIKSLQK